MHGRKNIKFIGFRKPEEVMNILKQQNILIKIQYSR